MNDRTAPPTLEDIFGVPGLTPAPSAVPQLVRTSNNVVRRGPEFDRIAALPRRLIAFEHEIAQHMGARLRGSHGTMTLRPVQALALLEAESQQGAFFPIGVGFGKTLIGFLLPTVLDSKSFVYLTTPGLVGQVKREMRDYAEHWQIRSDAIHVVAYSTLSTIKGQDLLDRLAPDAIYADEAHNLRHLTSTRTKRLARYLDAHEATRFCAASGSITSKSIRDYAHLIAWALKHGSPLPTRATIVDEWARALDAQLGPREIPNEPGALWDFCAAGEEPRQGFRRRLVDTVGVVATTESALGTGLEIRALTPKFKTCAELVKKASKEGLWDDMVLDPLAEARVTRQLALGFHYKWVWPDGVVDEEWVKARNGWARAVRNYLGRTDTPGMDSPLLLANAVDRGDMRGTAVERALERWRAVQDRPEPPVEPVWHNQDELLDFVQAWLEEEDRKISSIVWYEHRAVGDLLEQTRAFRPQGKEDPALLKGVDLLLSIKKHGVGRNLQPWCRNLVLTPPSSGAICEQLFARTHRPGQQADTVTVDVLQHVAPYRGAMQQAREDAAYIEATTGQVQKLSLATFIDFKE